MSRSNIQLASRENTCIQHFNRIFFPGSFFYSIGNVQILSYCAGMIRILWFTFMLNFLQKCTVRTMEKFNLHTYIPQLYPFQGTFSAGLCSFCQTKKEENIEENNNRYMETLLQLIHCPKIIHFEGQSKEDYVICLRKSKSPAIVGCI